MSLKNLLRKVCLIYLSVLLLGSCFQATAKEVTLNVTYVHIRKYGFVADTLHGVEARYNPWGKNYDCGELIRRYYKELYGLDIALYGNMPHVVGNSEYWFEKVEEPQTGDVLFATAWARGKAYGHWAICKVADKEANTITMFEQNWRWNGNAGVSRQIPYEGNCYTYYRLRYAKGAALTLDQQETVAQIRERTEAAERELEDQRLQYQAQLEVRRDQVQALCSYYESLAQTAAQNFK